VLYDQLHTYVPPEVAEMGGDAMEAGEGWPYGELDIFGTPSSMNIVDDRPPKARSGFGAVKDVKD
jgi:hypothetical protein